jgi:fibronectin type 3 domain-containing protein
MRGRLPLALSCSVAMACANLPVPSIVELPIRGREELAVETQPSATLPVPEGLRAQSGEYRLIPLKWDPLLTGDVAGYVVERSPVADGPYTRLAVLRGRGTLALVDRGDDEGLGDGVTYYYRVRAFDAAGHLAREASPLAVGTTARLPDPPEGLRAYSRQPREVPLSWRASGANNVAGYVVERSPSAGGPWEVVAESDDRFASTAIDRDLGDLRVFYYRVSARNAAGVSGPPSEPVRAVTKPVPLPPIELRVAAQSLGTNELEWDPNVEEDLAGYRLFRSDGRAVATVDAHTTHATDAFVAAGERVTYSVVAIDLDGLESAPAQGVEVGGQDYDLRAAIVEGAIELRWDPRVGEGYDGAEVERDHWLERARTTRVTGGVFRDTSATAGRRYAYRVTLVRGDGSRAPTSAPVAIELPEGLAASGGSL